MRGVGQERVGVLTDQTNVVELGLDSLERVEIVQRIENELGITFSQPELLRIETCGEIAKSAERLLTEFGDAERGQIPESHYRFDKTPEYQQLKRTQSAFGSYGYAMPYFGVHEGNARATTVVNGHELVNFASYNYLGMSGDPDVNRAAASFHHALRDQRLGESYRFRRAPGTSAAGARNCRHVARRRGARVRRWPLDERDDDRTSVW